MTTTTTTAKNVLSQALEAVNTTPSYTKFRCIQFGEDLIYYVGNFELLSTTLIAMLQYRPSNSAQLLSNLCLGQIRERKATLITNGDIPLAAKMAANGGKVVLLLACGIKKVSLKTLLPGMRDGNVLVISLSAYDVSDDENTATINRMLAALCYCAFMVECQGGGWNSTKNQWGNHLMQTCELLFSHGKSIFIAPWHRGHPAQHLVIKHEFQAIDLPESEDPKKVFSFIPENLD